MTRERILDTARLRLEPIRPADVPALHAHWTDPDVLRFLWDGRTISVGEVRKVVRTSERLFRERGAGLWALRPLHSVVPEVASADGEPAGGADRHAAARDQGTLLGCAGFWFFHEPPELELVLSLSPQHWGRGLAHESARTLIDFAFARLGWDAVQASADAPNEASLKLLRRLGMRPAGERPGVFGPILVLRVDRSEWQTRREPADAWPSL